METLELVGLIAAVLTTGAFVPQVYKLYKTKSTADVSLTMYSSLFIGVMLWLYYGFQKESIPIILANAITGLLILTVIFLKLKYK